jgi:hypothetical protein
VAATRDLTVTYADATSEFIRIFSITTQITTLTRIYNFGISPGFDTAVSNTHIQTTLPATSYLQEGDIIATDILAIQAADQISSVRLRVLEWLAIIV